MLLTALLLYLNIVEGLSDLCPKGWQFISDSSYCVTISSQIFSANDANNYCTSQNSSLATLSLQSEMSSLIAITSNQQLPPWMGSSRTSNGAWKWNTGTAVSSTYWAKNEPSIYGDCATLRSSGMTACPCYNEQPALCKLKPQLCNGGKFGGSNIRYGTINSPGYPDQYYNNLDCYYQIEGPAGTHITIDFDPFNVEAYYDYVDIFEGNTTKKMIGGLNSNTASKTSFESASNQMLIYFHTDGMITNTGWLGQWTAVTDSPATSQNGTSGELTSPNYPNNYDRFLNQMYYVTSPERTTISIIFDEFTTEERYDYLEIYDGDVITAPLLANLSGYSVSGSSYNTSGNLLTMRFVTDGSSEYFGWHMLWNAS